MFLLSKPWIFQFQGQFSPATRYTSEQYPKIGLDHFSYMGVSNIVYRMSTVPCDPVLDHHFRNDDDMEKPILDRKCLLWAVNFKLLGYTFNEETHSQQFVLNVGYRIRAQKHAGCDQLNFTRHVSFSDFVSWNLTAIRNCCEFARGITPGCSS